MLETYSLIIKGDEQTASRELARVIGHCDYSYRVHAVMEDSVTIILSAPRCVEPLLCEWFAEGANIGRALFPLFPSDTLLHWRRVYPGDGSPSGRTIEQD